MKRSVYLFIIFLFSCTFIHAQSITVTKPVSGESWEKNVHHLVEWTFNGNIHEFVKIRLYSADGSRKIKEIVNSVSSEDRRYRIPENFFIGVSDGSYVIRVKAIDNSVYDNSAAFFIGAAPTIDQTIHQPGITEQPPASELLKRKFRDSRTSTHNINIRGTIKITYPNKGTNWRLKLGDTALPFPIRIQWEKSILGKHENRVKIFLKRRINDRYMRKNIVLDPNAANSGLFTGNISRNLITSLYAVTIETLGGKLLAESEIFHITNAENDSN